MEAGSPDFLTNFFNGMGNAIGEALLGIGVLALSSMAAAPAVSSLVQLQLAKRWKRLHSSIFLSAIVGAVLSLMSAYALVLIFALPDGKLYELNSIYQVFPVGAGLLWLVALLVHFRNRATFDKARAAGMAGGMAAIGLLWLMG